MGAPVLTGFEHRLVVGVADVAVSNNPNVILTTYSLGSCVAVAIYDPQARVGGMLHAMLPDSSIDTAKAQRSPSMFIDSGVAALFRASYELRADKQRVQIYIAGGAQIMDAAGVFNIGKRNVEAVTALLNRHGLRIQAQQVGGMVNRTMSLNLATGEVSLKISGQPEEMFLCRNSRQLSAA
jgi:chemotaxis protein CheD